MFLNVYQGHSNLFYSGGKKQKGVERVYVFLWLGDIPFFLQNYVVLCLSDHIQKKSYVQKQILKFW